MGSQRHTGAFIAGSVLGGMIGAAVALWKTPQSGPELRASLTGDRAGAVTYGSETATGETPERRFSNPVLGFVEKAAAPIVGVELGKLAKDDPQSYTAPLRTSAADARPPSAGTVTGTSGASQVTAPLDAVEPATSADFPAATASDERTHDAIEGSSAHVATAAELTTPTEDYVEELEHEHETEHVRQVGDFHFRAEPEDDQNR